MPRDKRFRHISIATAVVGLLGAVTAFGVAPLTEIELPPRQHIVETLPIEVETPAPIDRFVQAETVRRGDTLAQMLARLGANDPAFLDFVAKDKVARQVLQLRTGRSIQAEVDSLGRVQRFVHRTGGLQEAAEAGSDPQPQSRIEIVRNDDSFVASEEAIPLERSVEVRSLQIESTLFAATDAAGIPEGVAIGIAKIFEGDLDFSRDLRKGDRLRVAYETVREADSLDVAQAGRILAVELRNRGQRRDAFWFERDSHGQGEYVGFDGRSLKKSFLRNPLEFSRITSGFSNGRRHPVMRDWRAHRGVDLAAPTGTPIRATADGTVEFIGSQRGYGNVVVLAHRNGYSTLYAHLNSFARGLAVGDQVIQGATIGGVGSTGWATGPHLHYEVRINGEQVDPFGVALPESHALSTAERKRLREYVAEVRSQFAQLDAVRVASFQ